MLVQDERIFEEHSMSSDAEQPAEDFSKTDEQWKQKLTAEQFRVTRKKGTERAFTGKYWDCKSDGMYHCVCCGVSLFSSDAKFDSGTGWPSFVEPADQINVAEQ